MLIPDIGAITENIANYYQADDLDLALNVDWSKQPAILQMHKADIIHDINCTYEFCANSLALHDSRKVMATKSMRVSIIETALKESLFLYYLHGNKDFGYNEVIANLRNTIRILIEKSGLELYVKRYPTHMAQVEHLESLVASAAQVNERANSFDDMINLTKEKGFSHAIAEFQSIHRSAVIDKYQDMELSGTVTGGVIGEGLFETEQYADRGDESVSDDITNKELDAHFLPSDEDVRREQERVDKDMDHRLKIQALGKRTKMAHEKRLKQIAEQQAKNADGDDELDFIL